VLRRGALNPAPLPSKPLQEERIMPPKKNDYPEFQVQINLVYYIRARDEMQALNNIIKSISLLKPPGMLTGAVKWQGVKKVSE
jgi:hypothetical protein